MRIRLLVIGKTSDPYLREGIEVYLKRLLHYCEFTQEVVADIKNAGSLSREKLKEAECDSITRKIKPGELVILLDENGKEMSSTKFSALIEKWMVDGKNNVVFIIGGAFGFDERLKQLAHMKLSLSPMTFSHQMVRLIFCEQLYRAFTIIKGEKYHHE